MCQVRKRYTLLVSIIVLLAVSGPAAYGSDRKHGAWDTQYVGLSCWGEPGSSLGEHCCGLLPRCPASTSYNGVLQPALSLGIGIARSSAVGWGTRSMSWCTGCDLIPQTEQVITAASAGEAPVSKRQDTLSSDEITRAQVEAWVRELAPAYDLDPELILALITVESMFNPVARSPKSAQGLMQLMPATADRFGVTDVLDPVDNLRGGMAYLRWLLVRFKGDLRLALAGYNAGEGAVRRYRGIPPYKETQRYVERITRAYGKTRHPVPTLS